MSKPYAVVDLALVAGDTYTHRFTYQRQDGSPIDLTGATVRSHFRLSAASGAPPAVDLSSDGDGIALDEAEGIIEISIASDQTKALSGCYVWDLEIESTAGEIRTIVGGKVDVTPEVTR